jgi:hypothetical protein
MTCRFLHQQITRYENEFSEIGSTACFSVLVRNLCCLSVRLSSSHVVALHASAVSIAYGPTGCTMSGVWL